MRVGSSRRARRSPSALSGTQTGSPPQAAEPVLKSPECNSQRDAETMCRNFVDGYLPGSLDQPRLNWIAGFIWNIADDVLRDLYVRGKYRDS